MVHRGSTSDVAGGCGTGTEHVRQPNGRTWFVSMSAVSVAPRSGISATMRMSTALTEALLRRSTHPCLFMEDRMDRELRARIRRAGSCRWVEMWPTSGPGLRVLRARVA
jgi:hypothetical protein